MCSQVHRHQLLLICILYSMSLNVSAFLDIACLLQNLTKELGFVFCLMIEPAVERLP